MQNLTDKAILDEDPVSEDTLNTDAVEQLRKIGQQLINGSKRPDILGRRILILSEYLYIKHRKPRKVKTKKMGYYLDTSVNNIVLRERTQNSTGTCTWPVYENTAKMLQEQEEAGILVSEIRTKVSTNLGYDVSEAAIRVALRFWATGDPVVIRNRTKYFPIKPETFIDDIVERWKSLENLADVG